MTFRSLYHTEVINDAGLNGHARVTLGGDLDVLTSSPLQDDPGTNPEQLLGLALATCLNATIEAEEGRRGLEHAAEVKVGVDMGKDTEGYQFFWTARSGFPKSLKQRPKRSWSSANAAAQFLKSLVQAKTSGCTWLSNSHFRGGEHEVLSH